MIADLPLVFEQVLPGIIVIIGIVNGSTASSLRTLIPAFKSIAPVIGSGKSVPIIITKI
ncbi:hypothetical protein D3C81_1107750 [compost metagenome]